MGKFYNNLLSTPELRRNSLHLEAFYQQTHDLMDLDAPISEAEVWETIKNLPLGPDGFTGRFYRTCWSIIKQDVMAVVGAVHGGDARQLQLLNSAFIVLIPKKEEAVRIGDFRPISLVHSFAKLITKILANQLMPR